jgi:U4/U6.U5 tri-snRNP-associated protein 2
LGSPNPKTKMKRLAENDDIDVRNAKKEKIIENNSINNNSNEIVSIHNIDNNEIVNDHSINPTNSRRKCPYLDSVNRHKLDFDQQKICSVTLTNMNVYACLVCGKFFQGKSSTTPAYTHSVQMGHFVFINLQDTRTFCLPDGYEIIDAALNDIKRCLAPSFSLEDIKQLDTNSSLARDVYGVSYLPGAVGLNNLNCTDYINVVLHALSHVTPLRNFLLQDPLPGVDKNTAIQMQEKYPLLKSFAEVVRKMWSRDNFKSVISPAEFTHVLSIKSKRRFVVGQRREVSDLLAWLLNEFHRFSNYL